MFETELWRRAYSEWNNVSEDISLCLTYAKLTTRYPATDQTDVYSELPIHDSSDKIENSKFVSDFKRKVFFLLRIQDS